MKFTGHIAYDDAGNVCAFLESPTGQMMEVGSQQVDWQAFDTPEKAKKDAATKLRHNTAEALADAAMMFRARNIIQDLS